MSLSQIRSLGCVLLATTSFAVALSTPSPAQQSRRAILVSFDAFSEQRLRQFTDSTSAPAFWSLFRDGACAEAARPAFPSVTPVSHAAIWTGVYGNVNGVTSIRNGRLPLAATTIMETTDGFGAHVLRAEPLWIAAARQGLRVFAHSVTQAPAPPGYPDDGAPSTAMARRRTQAAEVLAGENIDVVNGYNRLINPARVITGSDSWPTAAAGWRGLDRIGPHGVPLREVSWAFADDSLHALIYGERSYTTMLVAPQRDASRGVVVQLAPVDTTSPRGRPLARFFSEALRMDVPAGRTFVFARLFELAPDLSSFMLFVSEARVVDGNRPAVAAAYNAEVGGFIGNGASRMRERGVFGPSLSQGGDGSAEWRYLETVELATRQFMRGSEWASRDRPDLLIDYFPYPDETLHSWLGYADSSTPGIAPSVRAGTAAFLARSYTLIDLRLAALRAFAEQDSTLLLVTGEHGMRPTWRLFFPNVALREAGLLAADSAGEIDLSRTMAAAPNNNWIAVNRASRRNGIVPPDSVETVMLAVERALRSARDSSGAPIVTRIWRATGIEADSLGIGGPAGGDIYFGLAPGTYVSAETNGPLLGGMEPRGSHGFPSVDADMQPALCALGPAIAPHRFGAVRLIDAAPTIAEWLGITPPLDARGASLLPAIKSRD